MFASWVMSPTARAACNAPVSALTVSG